MLASCKFSIDQLSAMSSEASARCRYLGVIVVGISAVLTARRS